MRSRFQAIMVLFLILMPVAALDAQENGAFESHPDEAGPTPPRLSFTDGQVSFSRGEGAQDWTPAHVNMPLSPGDRIETGSPGNFEIQIGDRAFACGWANTRIVFENLKPDYLHLKVTQAILHWICARWNPDRQTEVLTPNATFTIEQAGFYRVNVAGERTAFVIRRGGSAVVSAADGASSNLLPDSETVIAGRQPADDFLHLRPRPPMPDDWNFARKRLASGLRERPLCPARHIRNVRSRPSRPLARRSPSTGRCGSLSSPPAGWVPYSTGYWVHDRYYSWTWVDHRPVGLGALSLRALGSR